MSQYVEAATVGDSDEDFVRTALRSQLHRLVEHRNEDVEALDRELLLADERPPQVCLERLDLREALRSSRRSSAGSSVLKRPDSIACRSQTRSA